MLTNLLATVVVCIVTNVTTTDNAGSYQLPTCDYMETVIETVHDVYVYPQDDPVQFWSGGKPAPATERTETTEIIERTTIRFDWAGESWSSTKDKVLSRKVRKWRLKTSEQWVEE